MQKSEKLFLWYKTNKRSLPWRNNPNPYRIWIAEIMLQQTTVQTVIPYYKKFLKKFPNLKSLAESSVQDILTYWSGLGYYSRVKNLHQCARLFAKKTIPKTAKELEKYPGLGPYTSKALSSQAYGEPVSVLDGNVIRFLCRHENLFIEWWKKKEKSNLEKRADHWRKGFPSGEMNQALMEIGALICTPKSPSCSLCPVRKTCKAKKFGNIEKLPLKKKRKKKEIWLWKPRIIIKNQKIILTKKHKCPFLKSQWLPPGSIQKLSTFPKHYHFRHSITHYDIFVQLKLNTILTKTVDYSQYLEQSLHSIKRTVPFSLITKILSHID